MAKFYILLLRNSKKQLLNIYLTLAYEKFFPDFFGEHESKIVTENVVYYKNIILYVFLFNNYTNLIRFCRHAINDAYLNDVKIHYHARFNKK